MILEAQKHTKSNMAASRWMGVTYNTYKKYAKITQKLQKKIFSYHSFLFIF